MRDLFRAIIRECHIFVLKTHHFIVSQTIKLSMARLSQSGTLNMPVPNGNTNVGFRVLARRPRVGHVTAAKHGKTRQNRTNVASLFRQSRIGS